MNIERKEIMRAIAEWFGVEADENGDYDIDSYDWVAGCSQGSWDKPWITLGEFVHCMESFLEDLDPYDYVDFDD